ncbi:U-box domain-containing protein 36-like [Oryza brachyantha]|uniref:U-box domain-containing protein 36-like n=1 Tax=Oryza brachyantha TaxID=4533 RepID=UPI0003EABA5C|nr:U-box domain-containing protein 36-like [Oryza brachyantha]
MDQATRAAPPAAAAAAAEVEKVFVVVPAEKGRSTLSWAIGYFRGSGAKLVITHVHVPPQTIPVMGVQFHVSNVSPEQVSLFRRIERERVDKLLDDYVHQCWKMKVKCEKLVIEKEDIVAGLLELITLHSITKLVIAAAADKHFSRKMDKPKSKTATEIMERADPSCQIWFVCKEQLICTRDKKVETAPADTSLSQLFKIDAPPSPDIGHSILHPSPHQEQNDSKMELGLYDELNDACIAAENLMERALSESLRRQKADEEVVSSLQRVKQFEELYLEEVKRRKELEGALFRANRELARLKQEMDIPRDIQSTILGERQEVITDRFMSRQRAVAMKSDLGSIRQVIKPQQEYLQLHLDHDNGVRQPETLLHQRNLSAFSTSSDAQSQFDKETIPSHFICPISQEVMREPCIAADGFTYEAEAIINWFDEGHEVSPMTEQPLVRRDLIPNFALRSVIQDYTRRKQFSFS